MSSVSRREFLKRASAQALGTYGVSFAMARSCCSAARDKRRSQPNILFAIADDWSYPHASAYGANGVKTPTFDRLAREGCLFTNAFAAAPQCSPNRAAALTGLNIWQLEEAGTHSSIFPSKFVVFPDLLEAAGYHVGFTGKGWSPGDWKRGGRRRNPAGPEYNAVALQTASASGISKLDYPANFDHFLKARPRTPFFFWFGAHEPHRTYEPGSGLRSSKSLEHAPLPSFLPDDSAVRSDVLDYLLEVEWFDSQLGTMLTRLEDLGELDNTIVVVTSDNGMPFPRAKANLYEYGTHVPLVVRWPERISAGRTVDKLVSFVDFAPTFLEAADEPTPSEMTGKSFLGFAAEMESPLAPEHDYVLTGRERHTHARYDNLGYPSRAIRTHGFLYIRNLKPDRWPAGDPEGYYDVDDSPTKTLMLERRHDYPELFEWAFGKRSEEELYDIGNDPACLRNLALVRDYDEERRRLRTRLMCILTEQKDPRALGVEDIFESYPRFGTMRPELGGFSKEGKYNPAYQPRSKSRSHRDAKKE